MPEGIVFRTVKRYYDKDAKDYYDKNGEYCAVLNNEYITKNLNEEVELIEEQQDIDIQELEEIKYPAHNLTRDLRDVKINELIRAIKQLDKNVNKKHCEVCGVELDQNNTALPNMCWECKYGEER